VALKIRLLTDVAEWGGTEMHVLHLGRTLLERGHDVAIVELGRPAYEADGRAAAAGIGLVHPDRRQPPSRLPQTLAADVCVLAKGFIDVGNWRLDLAARLSGARYVTIEHLTCPMPPRRSARHLAGVPGVGLWWYRLRARRRARAVWPHRVICVSDAVRRELASGYRFPPRKLVTVRNGIDSATFVRDEAARQAWRARWGAGNGTVVFGAVGRLSAMKGYDVAIETFARVVAEGGGDVRLVLAGEGPARSTLDALARSAGVADRVIFAGPTTAPQEIYAALDVFVMPSRSEGLPLALLEAMACGCAPIAMAVGGIPEVIGSPEIGWLVGAADRPAFLDAMSAAAALPLSGLAEIGDRARRHVAAHFDARTQFAEVARVIEETARA